MFDKEKLSTLLQARQQQHLLDHWDALNDDERQCLADQIESLDFDKLLNVIQDHGQDPSATSNQEPAKITPPPAIRLGQNQKSQEALAAGEKALRAGEIAMIIVAGGQGSRLSFDHPKGMYPIGAVSGRTLFQVIIDQLLAVQSRYDCTIPLFVMTSPATHDETATYFRDEKNLGLQTSQLHIFCQGTMPAFDIETRRILMSGPSSLALSPDGHGGMLAALANSGGLDAAQQDNVKHFFYCQIDNPLVPVCDPTWIGHHLLHESDITTIAAKKNMPSDPVGNIVAVDDVVQIIEYSEFEKLPEEVGRQRDENEQLVLWAGNIAVHVMALDLLKRMAEIQLPIHRAKKKVEYYSAGRIIKPAEINAYKLERFIFDLLQTAARPLVLECDKSTCFAPVKNSNDDPSDNPNSAMSALVGLQSTWLDRCGVQIDPGCLVEINPRWAMDENEVKSRLEERSVIRKSTYWNENGDEVESNT